MDRDKLEKIIPFIAEKYNFRLETIEKDYYLTLILNSVESHLSDKIVFKGGTLLNKIHLNYHRLSEDIDFTYFNPEGLQTRSRRSRAITPIREKMPELLKLLELKSERPEGEGFNNSTQYVFNIFYPSFISGKDEKIKLEISLRQTPIDKPVHNVITHFYKDPFTGEDLIPKNKILSLTLNEAVAEKLKAAITRKDVAIRDYYDLWFISEAKFDFKDRHFLSIFKKKLEAEKYRANYSHNFGLDQQSKELLHKQIETELIPVIRVGESFNLDKVFERFNEILKKP
ncbi:MAG: nucleotidyl transferase AbiEii/AbiGii toxin family protein [Candidatus Omnitrophota bacterium]|nr:nucleotidyl transferase AbiEii/AbiGii toxin family protein [Candidatus Omnitrophota bacterium]